MAINWDRYIKRERGSLLFGGIMCLVVAALGLLAYFTRVPLNTKNDLVFISGPFEEYRWVDLGERGGSSTTLTLQNYDNRFKIKVDFYPILNKDKFLAIPRGDTLTIGIPKSFTKYLNTNKNPFFVYSIASKNCTYLKLEDAIAKHNSPFLLFAAGVFAVCGYAFIYFGRRAKLKKVAA